MKTRETHDIMVGVTQDASGFYRAVAYAEIDGVAARFEYRTEPQTSRTKARAITYALTELALMFDRGAIRLEEEGETP